LRGHWKRDVLEWASMISRLRTVAIALVLGALTACGGDEDRGHRQLVDVAGRPPGDECEAGGAEIRSGTDGDGDGVLDEEEVEQVELVCGAGGQGGTLVELTPEPPGPHCDEGGVAIVTGSDDNQDGELDEDEISSLEYVCGASLAMNPEEIQGDVLVSNQIDAQKLRGVRVIHGDLFIGAPGLGSVDLSTLEEIDEHFAIDQFSLLVLDAPALQRVGLDLLIVSRIMTAASFPALAHVGGDLEVEARDLQTIDLTSLESVGNDVTLGKVHLHGTRITQLELPALLHAERGIDIENEAELTSLSAPILEETYSLSLEDDVSLAEVDLPSATSIPRFSARRNYSLPTCRAEELADQLAATTVTIDSNDDSGVCQ
jgi:hypothetical protein